MTELRTVERPCNIKVNDSGTKIQFYAYDDNGRISFTQNDTLLFKIKNSMGYVTEVQGQSASGGYIAELNSSDLQVLTPDTYFIELWVTQNGNTVIYPDKAFCPIAVTQNVLSIAGDVLPTTSLSDFENSLKAYVEQQTSTATKNIKNDFDTYVDNLTDSTMATATKASQDATTAINTANTAKSTADTAKSTADTAKSTADSAFDTANKAKSTAESAQNTVADILNKAPILQNGLNNFGGRNYLLNSRDNRNKSQSEWSYYAGNVVSGETFLNSIISKTNIGWSKNVGAYNPYDLVKRNIYNTVDDFVFSIYVKKDPNVTLTDANIDFCSTATNKNLELINTSNISTDWSRIYISFKFTKQASDISNAQNASESIRFEPNTNIQNGYLYFTCPKLEKGTVPTDYTPAPEDLENQLASIQQAQSTMLTQMANMQASLNEGGSK